MRLGEIFNPATGPLQPVEITLKPGFSYGDYIKSLDAAAEALRVEALGLHRVEEENHAA